MLKHILLMVAVPCLLLGFTLPARTSQMHRESGGCEYWQSKADSLVRVAVKSSEVDETDPSTIMFAIECLLQMEGNKHPAAFSGAVSLTVSDTFENTTADVAALYYISYLYYQKYDHADAVALRAPGGLINTPSVIHDAYQAYKKWFQEVKRIGLIRAREMKLDPLKGTNVRWY